MPRVKLRTGELRDEIAIPLYDTIDIVAAESPIGSRRFFSDVQGKSRTLSNLRQNGQLEGYVSYRILGMCLDADNTDSTTRRALPLIQKHSALTLRVGEKEYYEGNGVHWAGRIRHEESTGNAELVMYQHFGREAVHSIVLGARHYVDIPPLQSFRVDWLTDGMSAAEEAAATPAADQKLRFLCSLKGIQRRPVQ